MTNVLLHGYRGRMGCVLCDLLEKTAGMSVVAGVDHHTAQPAPSFPVFNRISDCDVPADVIIDFSNASAIGDLLDYALQKKTPIVLCTTGRSADIEEKIIACSEEIAIFRSANMSFGVNLMADILEKYSKVLYESGFDIEIIEKHHNQKVDAPSGTALLLADTIKNTLDPTVSYTFDRSQCRRKRVREEIGISSLRGGSIVGEHTVLFAGHNEVLEIKHEAFSREIFAMGAIKAALFLSTKKTGLYTMKDLIKEING